MRTDSENKEYRRRVSKGLCTNHRDIMAVPGKTMCATCLSRIKAGQIRRVKAGLCRVHAFKKAVLGKTNCCECLLRKRLEFLRKDGVSEKEIQRAERQLQKNKGRCEVCKAEVSFGNKDFCLDHDRKTKKFRGILCGRCNMALGFVRDSIKILKALIKYLKQESK
jgi:hypothetical protein